MKAWSLIILTCLSFYSYANKLESIESITNKIESNLKVGTPVEKVELFLEDSGWLYSYDKYQSRFQVLITEEQSDCSGRSLLLWLFYDCAIQVYLNVENNSHLTSYVIQQTYGGL